MFNFFSKKQKEGAKKSKPDFETLKKKWNKHSDVSMWIKNGWLENEKQDVIEYYYKEWEKHGIPSPPPHPVKEGTVREYAQKYNLNTLIETGTYQGRMIEQVKNIFKRIESVEIDPELVAKAKEKFKSYNHISFHCGDSGNIMPLIINKTDAPVLFWLDAHYCHRSEVRAEKDCPIYEELDAIFSKPIDHVLLIDDARLFVGLNDYPIFEELKKYILSIKPHYSVIIKNDIIIAEPNK